MLAAEQLFQPFGKGAAGAALRLVFGKGCSSWSCRLRRSALLLRRCEGKMHPVHESSILVLGQERRVIRNRGEERLDPVSVILGKIVQHVAVHQLLGAGMA